MLKWFGKGTSVQRMADEKKFVKLYSPEELQRIYMELHPGSLLVPVKQELPTAPNTGPRFFVFRLYSEMGLEPTDPETAYWYALQEADVIDAIGELSWINANLTDARAIYRKIHSDMVARFVAPELLPRISNADLQGEAFSVVFHQLGCLLAIRHLIVFGGTNPQEWNAYKVGRLALLANDFVQSTPNPPTSTPTNLELLLLMAPTWDINNVRNMAHGMSRIFTILTEIMPGGDPTVVTLRSRVGIAADKIEIDGIPLNQFASLSFGLFAYGSQQSPLPVLFGIKEIFAQTNFPQPLLEKFLKERAPTLDEFRALFSNDSVKTRAIFSGELRQHAFLTESLNLFRRRPFLKLNSEQVLILDRQFVAELLTSGVYWSIHDGLPTNKRGPFKELWGRMFELYTVEHLAQFYPQMSGILFSDVTYEDGQIDALLDFGSYILLLEIKSSLLTEPAKRSADKDSFLTDFRRKFVENERGKPKVIKQLSAACRAILAGKIKMASGGGSPTIYPIFVSDEPTVEATFMNAFFNEEFQREGIGDSKVKPLTVMSIDELEQLLPHVTDGDFTWEELLQSRFNEFGVYPNSVGQAIYDLRLVKGLSPKQNQALKRKYDEFAEIMRAIFQKPERG